MANRKTIAIIGATTEIGSGIAKRFAHVGEFQLLLVSDQPKKLHELKSELHKGAAEVSVETCERESSWEADIIILATPFDEALTIARKIREVATGKIVISVSNPIVEAYFNPDILKNSSVAEELQKVLAYSKVVETFNTLFPEEITIAKAHSKVIDVFIAGNSSDALETVSAMLTSNGFNPVVLFSRRLSNR